MGSAQTAQLGLAGGDLAIEVGDQLQAGLSGGGPGLGEIESLEQHSSAQAEEDEQDSTTGPRSGGQKLQLDDRPLFIERQRSTVGVLS